MRTTTTPAVVTAVVLPKIQQQEKCSVHNVMYILQLFYTCTAVVVVDAHNEVPGLRY